ncbi:MAG: hemolysin family protein [Blastocatellia bacterium]
MDSNWDHWFLLKLVVVFLLILANAFFVASEFALVSVRKSRISALATQGHAGARAALRLLENPRIFISVTQSGVTLASLGLGWIGEATIADDIFIPIFRRILPGQMTPYISAHAIGIIVAFSLVTYLVIVLGEITPKTLALAKTSTIALFVSIPLEIFYKAFRPLIGLLDLSSSLFLRVLGLKAAFPHAMIYSEEELRHIISMSYKSGVLNEQERQVIHNVFDFTDKVVREVMVPRPEVASMDSTLTFRQAEAQFIRTGYSRLPVHKEQRDNIIGVVHSKDLMSYSLPPSQFDLESVARKPLFVPDTASLGEALRQMQASKNHFGVVVDEHGGFEGIVTLEDLLEEIVGEIHDEYDEGGEQELYYNDSDGSVVVAGWMNVRDANKALSLGIPESDEYTTLAGFLLEQAGRVLAKGDQIEYGQMRFIVEDSQRHRIIRVRIRRSESPEQVAAATPE